MSPLELPVPSSQTLAHSPLDLAVCQLRYDKKLPAAEAATAWRIRQDVAEVFPVIEETPSEVNVGMGPQGLQVGSTAIRGWQLKSPDGAWTATIAAEFVSVETSRYETWTDFRTRFESLLRAVKEHIAPTFEQRLGLRYVDRLTHPSVTRASDWNGLVAAPLLGLVTDAAFSAAVVGQQQVVELRASDELEATLRCAILPASTPSGQPAFLLDTDCYRRGLQPFACDGILEGLDRLHVLALQVFEAAITPAFLTELRESGE